MDEHTYTQLVENFYTLIAAEMNSVEDMDLLQAADQIPNLISLVRAMECLRGDAFVLSGARPQITAENQDQMYKLDYDCRRRLSTIVARIKLDEVAFARAKKRVQWDLVGDYLVGHESE